MYGDDAICSSSCLPTLPSSKRYHQQNNINNLDFQNESIHYLLIQTHSLLDLIIELPEQIRAHFAHDKCQLKILN